MTSFAVIQTGGKQYKVAKGDVVKIEGVGEGKVGTRETEQNPSRANGKTGTRTA